MFPAARVGDPITHDQLVPCGVIRGPGFPTVMIEFMPAARGMPAMDEVACTGVISGGIAHPPPPPGGPPQPIVTGSTTVMIGFMPAARWIVDAAGCGALLGDVKIVAARTVLIGDMGGAGGGAGGGGGAAGPAGPAQAAQAHAQGISTSVGSVSQNQAGPLQPQEEEEREKTWIGIELKDFDGSPMPNQDFKVTLKGGQALSGRTDDKGYAKFENIDPDQGDVRFIDIPEQKGTDQQERKNK